MKIIITIIITFVIMLLTSWLLDWSFIATNYFRTGLVVLFIVIEGILGYFVFKSELKKINK